MKTVCFYTRNVRASGIRVILDNLKKKIDGIDIPIVTSIAQALRFDVIIPYGILESIDVYKANKEKCQLSLLIDAESLIDISQFHFFKGKKIVPFKSKMKELLRYFYHIRLERILFKNYKDIVLVSYGDKRYYEAKNGVNKYSYKIRIVQNGVDLPSTPKKIREKDGRIVLGFLSGWGDGNAPAGDDIKCFLEYVWRDAYRINPNLVLKLCGRGMSDIQKEYFRNYPNVYGIGEVKDLSDYFNQIDINLMIMPKHAGILNKMLDGFAYKCPTLCEPHNVLAFQNLPRCFYTYNDAETLVAAAEAIVSNSAEASNRTKLAFEYVRTYHNWDKNYDELASYLRSFLF